MRFALRQQIGEARQILRRLALRRPKLALSLAGMAGVMLTLRPNDRRVPSAERLVTLLGPLKPRRIRFIRRGVASGQLRNGILQFLLEAEQLDRFPSLVTFVEAEPLLRCRERGERIVVVSWHQGPWRATHAVLSKLEIPALLTVRRVRSEPDRDTDTVRTASQALPGDQARFMKRAHRALQDGTVVGLNLDCADVGRPAEFFGREVPLARGAVALARLSGARIIPMTARYLGYGWRIGVKFYEPLSTDGLSELAPADFEREVTARAIACFEEDARNHPDALRPRRIDWLLSMPSTRADRSASTEAPSSWWSRWGIQRWRTQDRRNWERAWSDDGYDPPWLRKGVSLEIIEAVDSGWFAAGCSVLDAGCGEGDVAAWLSERGFDCVGVDIADAAVHRARDLYGEKPGVLHFERVDLCQEQPKRSPFQAIVDRGCFLQIREEERLRYVAQLAGICAPNARVLLYDRAFRDGIPYGEERELRLREWAMWRYVAPYFVIEESSPTYLDRNTDAPGERRIPGIVFRLVRTDRAVG